MVSIRCNGFPAHSVIRHDNVFAAICRVVYNYQKVCASIQTPNSMPRRDEIKFLPGKDAHFCFECRACGRCCGKFRIVVSPYDIIRLCKGTGCSTHELIERGTISIAGESFKKAFGFAPIANLFDLFGLPETDVVPIAVLRFRGGDLSGRECEFLSAPKEGKRLCGIYENRPTMCRLHPLGCITIGSRRRWFFRRPLCKKNSGAEQTVEGWVRESQLGPFLRANAHYLRWIRELLEQCEDFPSIAKDQWQLLGRIWYDFDSINMGRTVSVRFLDRMFHDWLSQIKKNTG